MNKTDVQDAEFVPGPTADLADFVQRQCTTGPVSHFELRHVQSAGAESKVGTVRVEAGQSPDSLARAIDAILRSDAAGWGGRQVYVVMSFRPGERQLDMRKLVAIEATHEADAPGVTDGPTERGVLAASMRHAEVANRLFLDAAVELKRKNERELERAVRRIEQLEAREDENNRMWVEMIREREQSQLDLLRAKREDRRDELVAKMVTDAVGLMGPAFLAKMLPAGTYTGPPPRAMTHLQAFVLGLSTLQKKQIMRLLAPHQIAALEPIIAAIESDKPVAFGDHTMKAFAESLSMPQFDAIREVLRPEQVEQLERALLPYVAEAQGVSMKDIQDGEVAPPTPPPSTEVH